MKTAFKIVMEAAAAGLSGECQTNDGRFAIRRQSRTIAAMTATPPAIVRAYRLSRQRVQQLVNQYSLELVSDPDKFFKTLLKGPSSKLRTALSDPARRAEICQRIEAQVEIPRLRSVIGELRQAIGPHEKTIAEQRDAIHQLRASISTHHKQIGRLIASLA